MGRFKSVAVEKPKRYLILTSSGGGGHTNAAEARKTELLALGIDPKEIDIIDLMGVYGNAVNGPKKDNAIIKPGQPWVPTYSFLGLNPFFSGKENTEKWNASQKEGTEEAVRKLENLVEMQPLAEAMQADEVKKNLLKYLEDNDVQEIYNTQALSTPAICQAVVEHNKHAHRKLTILTTVTDLITHRAEHFLSSLRKLEPAQAEVLQMEIAAKPMLDPYETEANFYKKYGIPDGLFMPKAPLKIKRTRMKSGEIIERVERVVEKVSSYPSPVKPEYLNNKAKKNEILIKADDKNGESKYITSKLTTGTYTPKDNDITITKGPKDKLITITMGSQGSNSVLEYMDDFERQVKDLPKGDKGNIYLCIAAGKNETGSLYGKVKDRSDEIMNNLPGHLKDRVKILPLAFQDAKHMASLLSNSDVLITRSGGMSSMEAEATNSKDSNRRVYVHSEAKLKFPDEFPKHSYDATYEALMTGTVKWEGGNAEYLLRKIGASLGSPETVDFGLSSEKEGSNFKENSLFHFAYDKELKEKNLPKIERLIREGSNPNLKFAGGSYLIDHCQDFETKKLLVEYGAKLTAKSLEGLGAEEKEELKEVQSSFGAKGSPKSPGNYIYNDRDKEKEDMAYKYLNPLEPRNTLEKLIVGIDNIGSFLKTKVLKIDAIHNALDGCRMYLQTDPTEKRGLIRSPIKMLKQLRNFAFDTTIFIAKQPINMVIKPIALASNIVKSGLISFGMVINEAKGEESNICTYDNLKATGREAFKNLKESVIAWGTAALVISGFGAPVAISLVATTIPITLGAAKFGAANAAVSGLNTALTQTVAFTNTPAASAVLMAEGVVEWGVVRPSIYYALSPEKLFYQQDQEGNSKLNALGDRTKKLYETLSKSEIDIDIKRQARAEIKKIMELQKIDKIAAPLIKGVVYGMKEDRER